jgi:hypothetical protein
MERISAFTDLCTPAGLFRYGTVAGGVPPTPVKAEWLNVVQEELCNFIRAYLPALDAEDNNQLLKAVKALILNYYTKPETDSLIAALVDSSPGALDTLRELADALGRDPNFATTMTNILALKAPLSSPALTDTPTAPTATFGNKSKQIANTEFVQTALAAGYPVGSLYFNASVGTNPVTLLGFGTWQAIGQGRMLIGVGSGTDSRGEARSFSLGSAAGEYSHVLTVDEIPPHTHTSPQGAVGGPPGDLSSGDDATSAVMSNPESSSAGGGEAHNNLPPYLAVYIWQRTA